MDQAVLSTISALAGTVVGGVTSFATSWLNTAAQNRAARLAAERARRDELYSRFLEEFARVYAHAASETELTWTTMVDIFALRGRILLQSSDPVAKAADGCIKYLFDLYMAPNRSAAEVRAELDDPTHGHDAMVTFSRAARDELRALR